MAEGPDKETQTEEATDKKVGDAIEKGNLPVSREVSTFVTFLSMLIVVAFVLKDAVRSLMPVLQQLLDTADNWSFRTAVDALVLVDAVMLKAGAFLVPILTIVLVGGLAASFAQSAPRFIVDRIMPDFSRISPVKGLQRLFSVKGAMEFLKSLFKFFAVGLVAVIILNSQARQIVNAMFLDPNVIGSTILSMVMRLLAAVVIATLALVVVDIAWSRRQWKQDLRMSKQEIKDEQKQMEGDPIVKSRLRSLAMDRSRKRMLGAVPRATLVIANPTHFAVALRYVREEGGAPIVIAKGKDLVALRIRSIAEEHGIPVIEDKPLARSMYDSVEVDQVIPAEFYKAVAQLIHFLYNRGAPRPAVR